MEQKFVKMFEYHMSVNTLFNIMVVIRNAQIEKYKNQKLMI